MSSSPKTCLLVVRVSGMLSWAGSTYTCRFSRSTYTLSLDQQSLKGSAKRYIPCLVNFNFALADCIFLGIHATWDPPFVRSQAQIEASLNMNGPAACNKKWLGKASSEVWLRRAAGLGAAAAVACCLLSLPDCLRGLPLSTSALRGGARGSQNWPVLRANSSADIGTRGDGVQKPKKFSG